MATKIKKRADITEPDEFLTFSDHVMLYMNDHWPMMSILATILIVAVLGMLYMNHMKGKKRNSLFMEIFKLEQIATKANRSSTIQELKNIVDEYDGVEGETFAQFALANQYLIAGEPKKAETLIKEIQANDPETLYSRIGDLELGYSLEFSGNYVAAIGRYKSIIDSGVQFTKAEAYLGMARCQEETGANDDAMETYKEFIQKFPDYKGGEFAKRRVRALEVASRSKSIRHPPKFP